MRLSAASIAVHTEEEPEHRCRCGRLLARHDAAGVWLRCPRCKREVVLDHEAGNEQRCACKRLLARATIAAPAAMAIRCPRCKREHPHSSREGWLPATSPPCRHR